MTRRVWEKQQITGDIQHARVVGNDDALFVSSLVSVHAQWKERAY